MNDTTIHLISGVEFDYADPMACEAITPHDVAHALARITRYNGHCAGEWSVAQHTLLVAALVRNHYNEPGLALGALHHDDAEFVTFDWPTPLKAYVKQCGFDYRRYLERPVESAVAKHLGLVLDDLHAGVIKDADDAAYEIEVRALKPSGHASREELDDDLRKYGEAIMLSLMMSETADIEAIWIRAHAQWSA
jgi:5'-deoxynucleotidase YfbR-like HD superfamily hydrolase